MAAPDVNLSFLVSGRLSYGCTNLATAWPHGGTGLGLTGGVVVSPPSEYVRHRSEGLNSTWSVQYRGGDLILGAQIESWSNDSLAKVWANVTAGTTDQKLVWPGADYKPGEYVDALALSPLVFTPRNESEHPGVILYKAVPLLDVNAQLALSSYRWLSYPVIFVALPDGTDRLGMMSTFGELSL